MEEKPKKRLGEILIEDGLLSRESLEEALAYQKQEGGLIGQILIQLGYITEEELISVLGKQLKLPYVPLANYAVNMEAVQLLGEAFSRQHMLVAFDVDEAHIYVALSDPLNRVWDEELKKISELRPQVFISTPSEIHGIFDLAFSRRSKQQEQTKKAG